jgi:enterochelin esterase-like enzyme
LLGELLQRKRARELGPGGQSTRVAQEVEPADPGAYRDRREQPPERRGRRPRGATAQMALLALLVVLALVWVAIGVQGTLSYGNGYLTYRGFPPPKDPPGVPRGRLVRFKIDSRALHRRQGILVYLPPRYKAMAARGHRFPVLYLLHGSPGSPLQFINVAAAGVALDQALQRHQVRPFLIAMLDGSDGTFYKDTEWANTPHGRYESWVLEAVRTVDQRFSTVRNRRGRGLGGVSEGAFASLNLALRHPKLFSVAEAWSGYATEKRAGPFRTATDAKILANSPSYYVPLRAVQLHRHPLHVYIYTGSHDRKRGTQEAFARELAAAGAHVTFATFHGRHDWALWRRETPRMLLYASRWFSGPLP